MTAARSPTMMPFYRPLSIATLLAFAPACAREPTQIIAVIETDLMVGTEIDRIMVRVAGSSGTPIEAVASLTGENSAALPLTIGIEAFDESAAGIRIDAEGQLAGRAVVTQIREVAFAAGQSRVLYLELLGRCRDADCSGGTTCGGCGCIPQEATIEEMPRWRGGDLPRAPESVACADGGMTDDAGRQPDGAGPDGGPRDASSEGGPDGGFEAHGSASHRLGLGEQHTCFATDGGAVLCWGADDHGQLGDRDIARDDTCALPCRLSPGPEVVGIADARGLVGGLNHGCAVSAADQLYCWGANFWGQVGDETVVDRDTPVMVLDNVRQVSSVEEHTCALNTTGTLTCWGKNDLGQVGAPIVVRAHPPDRDLPFEATPQLVTGLGGLIQVAVGRQHTCALAATGVVRCWGRGDRGALGDGSTDHGTRCHFDGDGAEVDCATSPVLVQDLNDAVQLAAGFRHNCALRRNGTVVCWGDNDMHQIAAAGDFFAAPTPIPGLDRVAAIALGSNHACAQLESGAVQCWGSNSWGQIGIGHTSEWEAPISPMRLPPVVEIALGRNHTCALQAGAGLLHCFGRNESGQLGDGTSFLRPAPTRVLGL